MEFEEFLECIKERVTESFDGSKHITLGEVIKNNDMRLSSLNISEKDSNIAQVIYLDDHYRRYEEGADLDDIVEDICDIYNEYNNKIDVDVNLYRDFAYVKDKIMYKLVNKESNELYLKNVPYMEFLDLAIVFYCYILDGTFGDAVILVNNEHLKMWETDVDRLYELARENTQRDLPAVISSLDELIDCIYLNGEECRSHRINKEELEMMTDDGSKEHIMYVLSNERRNYGAAVILYDNVLKEVASHFKRDLYILPSAVHEVILVPVCEETDDYDFNNMIRTINKEHVGHEDVLSDHAYYYLYAEDRIISVPDRN